MHMHILLSISARDQDDMKFICYDAIDCLFKAKTLSADVYIFPKSISEFPASVMRRIGQIFGEKMPAGNTVFFLFSLRTDLGSLERDVNRTRALFNAMLGNGFSSNDDPNSYYHFADEWRGKKIREVDNEFRQAWMVANSYLSTSSMANF